jgi:hypothetical protein
MGQQNVNVSRDFGQAHQLIVTTRTIAAAEGRWVGAVAVSSTSTAGRSKQVARLSGVEG